EPRISIGPNRTTCCPVANTSLRNGWFSHDTRIDAVRSSTTASKILKPGRRVDRKPQLRIRPESDADCPGLSDEIDWRRLRSSYRIGNRYSRSSSVRRPAFEKSAARRGPTPFKY